MAEFWFQSEGQWSRLGVTPERAAEIGGHWLALDLPREGDAFRAGETFAILATDRATHDLRAPRALRVLQSNLRAAQNPQLARLSPTGEGWLIEFEEWPEAGAVC